MKGIVVVHTRW